MFQKYNSALLYIIFIVWSFMAYCWDSIRVQKYSQSWGCKSTVEYLPSVHKTLCLSLNSKLQSLDLGSQMKYQQALYISFSLAVSWNLTCLFGFCVSVWTWFVLSERVSMHHMLEEGVRSPETGVTESCDLLCECWGVNPGSLERQPVISTTQPSLQPQKFPCCNWEFHVKSI